MAAVIVVLGAVVTVLADSGTGTSHDRLVVSGRYRVTGSTTSSTTTTTTTTTPAPEPEPEPAPSVQAAPSGPSNPAPARASTPAEPQPPPEPVIRVLTYSVTTDGPVSDVGTLDAVVQQTYANPRGWAGANIELHRVPSGGDFTIVLANASNVPNYDSLCDTTYSCQSGRFVVINDDRWTTGSPNWPGPLGAYARW